MSKKIAGLSSQHKTILDNMRNDIGFHGDWCLYVPDGQEPQHYGGYIPAMIFKDVPVHFPMNGPIYGDIPFVIGASLTEARQVCKLMNEYLQLDEHTVSDILDSAGLQPD